MAAPTIYWIPADCTGKIAIITRPGGHERLPEELKRLRNDGIDIVVSMLTLAESDELGLELQEHNCAALGLEYYNVPIPDRSIPENSVRFSKLAQSLAKAASCGKRIGVHCRMGVGRSALLCACILVAQGVDAEKAVKLIRRARGTDIPDTLEQLDWIRSFPSKLKTLEAAGLLLP